MTNLELPKTQRFNLIINWHPNPKREEELRGCLEANIRSGIFTKDINDIVKVFHESQENG